jgi:ribonucleoside-diphosphate reductase alpha chain
MELSHNAKAVLDKRYFMWGENWQKLCNRVASFVARAEPDGGQAIKFWAERFFDMMYEMDFLPNSPTLMNAGKHKGQLSACFVLPVEDTMHGIFGTLYDTAMIHKSGGGTGFNFSGLRHEGAVVSGTNGIASGPVSFMGLFDKATDVVKQGGARRGANMGILNCDHPDIEKFIRAKVNEGKFSNFNVSVGISDRFMRAVENNDTWTLWDVKNEEPVNVIDARYLWNLIVESAWKSGDPGLIFLDRIEEVNVLPNRKMQATNPCGEQPLAPYESCNLGSVNLANFIITKGGKKEVDWMRLGAVVSNSVRFLDDVITVNHYPIEKINHNSKLTRKIGLGVMGWADMLIQLGIRYGSPESIELAEDVMEFIHTEARVTSNELAIEKEPFELCEESMFGIETRNASVTTIAPTGTLSIIADCSSGIEPLFALAYNRPLMEGSDMYTFLNKSLAESLSSGDDPDEILEHVLKHGTLNGSKASKELQDIFVTAHDVPYKEHIAMQAAFQKYTDNAVSKTINMPNSASIKDVEECYMEAYKMRCKGITVYRDKCKAEQVLYHGGAQTVCEKCTI